MYQIKIWHEDGVFEKVGTRTECLLALDEYPDSKGYYEVKWLGYQYPIGRIERPIKKNCMASF